VTLLGYRNPGNDEEWLRQLMTLGVDGILTDDPERLRRIAAEEKKAG
jgi:glycerophosphoryl diester phosphodiesterase